MAGCEQSNWIHGKDVAWYCCRRGRESERLIHDITFFALCENNEKRQIIFAV